MVYAGGRPLWQLSLAVHDRSGPVPVLRWSPTIHRRIEAVRDRILRGVGTDEPLIEPTGLEAALIYVTRQWRKPLRVDEVARMAPTPEVRDRKGRA
jgi:hypothetical protein